MAKNEENQARKKSPRAPQISIEEALEKVKEIYERERRHAAAIDVIAQDLGYKSANNGAALSLIASLRYYGLLERPREGYLAVAKEVEEYTFAPSDEVRKRLLIQWLATPPLFAELLQKYEGGLPSDAAIKYDLIQRGFSPTSAESVLSALRKSVDFAGYYNNSNGQENIAAPVESPGEKVLSESLQLARQKPNDNSEMQISGVAGQVDQIPVRLAGNRKAWLVIPIPFFDADKTRLKAQIDLLLTDEDALSD